MLRDDSHHSASGGLPVAAEVVQSQEDIEETVRQRLMEEANHASVVSMRSLMSAFSEAQERERQEQRGSDGDTLSCGWRIFVRVSRSGVESNDALQTFLPFFLWNCLKWTCVGLLRQQR